MPDKENPRHLFQQVAGPDKSNASGLNYNNAENKKQTVFSLLPQGEGNAIRTCELVRLTGVRSARDLQAGIATEREQGFLILSTCRNGGGYYRPSDGTEGQKEIAAFIRTLRARALHTLVAIRSARKALEVIEEQITFDELEEL